MPYLPTATCELVLNEVHESSEIANDVEAQEVSALAADSDANVATAVVVSCHVQCLPIHKASPENIEQEHSSDSRFTIE